MPFASVDDLKINWREDGLGLPVVMINGIGADHTGWEMQIPALSTEYRVITFDNRDVGKTGASALLDYGIDRFAADTAGLMNEIGIDSAHIVGASMGGAIAQEFAICYPEKTRSVTIVCSWSTTDTWMFELMSQWDEVYRTQGRLAWERTTWLWVFTHKYFNKPGNLASLIEGSLANPLTQTLEMNRRQSAAFKRHDAIDRLPSISPPAHVICGAEDIYTPLRYSEAMVEAIPDAEFSVIPEAGHGMFWEATDLFNQTVLDFLRKVDGGDK